MKGGFPKAARGALANSQLRRNIGHATSTIRAKRARVVGEVDDWEALRDAGAEIKERTLRHLDVHLERLEEAVTRAGGTVHWARDGAEACQVVADVARAPDSRHVQDVGCVRLLRRIDRRGERHELEVPSEPDRPCLGETQVRPDAGGKPRERLVPDDVPGCELDDRLEDGRECPFRQDRGYPPRGSAREPPGMESIGEQRARRRREIGAV